MERLKIALFLTATGLIGIAPILLAAVYVARRRLERDGRDGRTSRPLRAIAAVTATLVVVGGILAWTFAEPGASPPDATGTMAGMAGMGGTATAGGALPTELASQPLTSHLVGPEAIAAVQQLHASDIPLTDAEVAIYGDGLVTIWRSSAPDARSAVEQVASMRERIAGGGSPFDVPHLARGHPGVYATRGMGLRHFFFARGTSVWWLSAVPDIARRALLETLEAAA